MHNKGTTDKNNIVLKVNKILVSQPKPASDKSPYFDIARKFDVNIDFKQFIKVESVTSKEFRQQKVTILDHTAKSPPYNRSHTYNTNSRNAMFHRCRLPRNQVL